MKKCPNCNDFALYDDNVSSCPICDKELIAYNRNANITNGNSSTPIKPNNTRNREQNIQSQIQSPPDFEHFNGLRYHYRGRVININHQARLHSRLKKWLNALFLGEPYQFGNTSHETVIRIEEFNQERISGRKKDFFYYGDVEGRFETNDDVVITAKRRRDRFIVTRLYSNETESIIRPGPQIPSIVIVLFTLSVLTVLGFLVCGLISLITSGVMFVLLEEAISVIIVVAILYWIVKTLFRR